MTIPGQPERVGGYTVRPAEPPDLDHLVVLLVALQDHMQESNPGLWQMSAQARKQLKSQLQSRLAAPNACALLAEHIEAGVVGAIFGRVTTSSRYVPSQAGVIDQAFVNKEHRRAGVGSQLVAELCRYFAAQGVEELTLRYVVGNDEAAAFWDGLGFEPRIMTVGASRLQVESRLAQHSGA
jgi:ribosomal protein S18 acetylase RimI-like enzyme